MDLPLTVALVALLLALTVFAGWRDMQPAGLNPRIAPWRLLLLLFGAATLILCVHLVNLMGLTTGRSQMAP